MNSLIAEINNAKAEHESALAKLKETQKHEEWLKQRRTRFTASEFHRLMGYENDPSYDERLTKGAISYAYDKYLQAISDSDGPQFATKATQWGNENEEQACERFMQETGIEVTKYGKDQEFIQLGSHIGCTPDGLTIEGGLETKCPDSKTHDNYLTTIVDQESFKEVCKNYYWQVQGSMYITGKDHWYFVSYDPRMKKEDEQILILKVERNEEDIQKLKNRLMMAIAQKAYFLKRRNKRKPLRVY